MNQNEKALYGDLIGIMLAIVVRERDGVALIRAALTAVEETLEAERAFERNLFTDSSVPLH